MSWRQHHPNLYVETPVSRVIPVAVGTRCVHRLTDPVRSHRAWRPLSDRRSPLRARFRDLRRQWPDVMSYDNDKRRLIVGNGYIDNVPAIVWEYEVSGKQVLTQ